MCHIGQYDESKGVTAGLLVPHHRIEQGWEPPVVADWQSDRAQNVPMPIDDPSPSRPARRASSATYTMPRRWPGHAATGTARCVRWHGPGCARS